VEPSRLQGCGVDALLVVSSACDKPTEPPVQLAAPSGPRPRIDAAMRSSNGCSTGRPGRRTMPAIPLIAEPYCTAPRRTSVSCDTSVSRSCSSTAGSASYSRHNSSSTIRSVP
jgi:hypothetical protein